MKTTREVGGLASSAALRAVLVALSVLLLLPSVPSRLVFAAPSYQIGDSATAQGVDKATYLPINRTSSFQPSDIVVVSWVKFTNVYSPAHSVNWVWLTPQGYAYWKPNGTIADPGAGLHWPSYYLYWDMGVTGSYASMIPGTWHIDVYVDGTLALVQNFTMASQGQSPQSPWVNLGPTNVADDEYGNCYATGYVVPCASATAAGKIAAFAYDPGSPSILYESCDGGAYHGAGCARGVFKSTDSGSTWQAVDNGFTANSATALTVKGGNPNSVVAMTNFAVFKTNDGGANWNETYDGQDFAGLSLYQTSNDTLYITNQNSIMKSSDFGSTWKQVSTFSVSSSEQVCSLAVTNGGGTIYAELYVGQGKGEVMKSTDGGRTWLASNTFSFGDSYGPSDHQIVVSPSNPLTVWLIAWTSYTSSSLLVSHDGGSTFQTVDVGSLGISNGLIAPQYLTYDPLSPSTMYLAGDGYLAKSTNGGSSFSTLKLYVDVRFIVVDPTNDQTVYVGSDQGLYRSSDGGSTWTSLNVGLSTLEAFSAGADGQRIFTIAQDFGEVYSCDGGQTWQNDLGSSCVTFSSNDVFQEWGTVGVNPYNSSNVILYTVGTASNYRLSACGGNVLYSTDGGRTFSKSSFSTSGLPCPSYYPGKPIIFDSKTPSIAYLGGGEGVYETRDYGATWTLLSGSPSAAFLATAPSDPNTVYASSSAGLYKSTNGGASWSLVNDLSFLQAANLTPDLFWIATDPLNDSIVVGTAMYSSAVAVSTDGGKTFSMVNPIQGNVGGPVQGYFGDLSISYVNSGASGAAVVLTGYMGVLVSYDQGAHWTDYTANLPKPTPGVESFFLSNDGTAYVTAIGSGLWAYKGFFTNPRLSVTYSVLGGGSGFSAPSITYVLGGKQQTTALPNGATSFVVDPGSSWNVTGTLAGSSKSERWATGQATAGTATASASISFFYYHQFALTASYSISGGGNPSAPGLSSTAFGKAYAQNLTMTPAVYWTDSGAAWRLTNPLGGSSSTERWQGGPLSGTMSSANSVTGAYYHQFLFSLKATPSAGGSVSPSSGWYNSSDKVTITATPTAGWTFGGWTGMGQGSYTGPDSTADVTINGAMTETAVFNIVATTSTSTGATSSTSSSTTASTSGATTSTTQSQSTLTTSTSSPTPTTTSTAASSSAVQTATSGIPELQYQDVGTTLFAALLVLSYLLVRRRRSAVA